jgi:hypothetical protein
MEALQKSPFCKGGFRGISEESVIRFFENPLMTNPATGNGPLTSDNAKTPDHNDRPRALRGWDFLRGYSSSLSFTPSIIRESATNSQRYFTSKSIMSYSWRRLFMI